MKQILGGLGGGRRSAQAGPRAAVPRLAFAFCAAVLAFGLTEAARAQVSASGASGYLNTPSAWAMPDGQLRLGYQQARPYRSIWATVQAAPSLQVYGRYQQIDSVAAFVGVPGANFGAYKDKAMGFKWTPWTSAEAADAADGTAPGRWSVALGADDIAPGNGLYRGTYVAGGWRGATPLGELEATAGWGDGRWGGAFAGARLVLKNWPRWAVAADAERIDLRRDPFAQSTVLAARRPGQLNWALEYQGQDGWGVQLGQRNGQAAVQVQLTAELARSNWVPKSEAELVTMPLAPPPTAQQWLQSDAHRQAAVAALRQAGFDVLRLAVQGERAELALHNTRWVHPDRALGQALRAALPHLPGSVRTLQLQWEVAGMAAARHTISDLKRWRQALRGAAPLAGAAAQLSAQPGSAEPHLEPAASTERAPRANGFSVQRLGGLPTVAWQMHSEGGSHASVQPRAHVFFNDPSGALKGALAIAAQGQWELARRWHLDWEIEATLAQNISDVTQSSNSLLPHVRTDVALYARGPRLKINRLLLARDAQLATGHYARVQAGWYEPMFAGVGVQWLYVPPKRPGPWQWSLEASLDALAQRDPQRALAFTALRAPTALASVQLRHESDVSLTVRAGRFLAGDVGLRAELVRQLASGVQLGVWASRTNARDITSPGTPQNPYQDKGVFLRWPLDLVSPSSSKTFAGVALSPWTRDVAQMVERPGDLRLKLQTDLLDAVQRAAQAAELAGQALP